jgi:hypothetical protein
VVGLPGRFPRILAKLAQLESKLQFPGAFECAFDKAGAGVSQKLKFAARMTCSYYKWSAASPGRDNLA